MGIFIHGLACPVNRTSSLRRKSHKLRFMPGAFLGIIDKPCHFQLSHNKINIPTLEQRLSERHDGLYFNCRIDSDSKLSALLVSGIEHRIIKGLSIACEVPPTVPTINGIKTIHKCNRIHEVSLVLDPAMDTWVQVGADPSISRYSFEETRYLLLSVLRQDFREPAPPKDEPPALMPVPSPEVDRELLEVQAHFPGRRVRRAPAGANYAWLVSGGSMLAAAR